MKQTATGRSKKIYASNWAAMIIAFSLLICAAPAGAQTDGGALNFDGSDDYVTIAHTSALSPTNVTLECWVNPSRGNVASTIITKEPNDGSHIGYGFIQRSNNTFGFEIGREGYGDKVTSVIFIPGNWYHLTGTFNGSTIRLYVNGVLQGVVNSSLSINSTTDIIIGNNASSSQPFMGSVDDVRIWNTAKCQGEVQYKMYCQLTGSESDLVAYYKFNQGLNMGVNPSVTTLVDASGNGFNGTLNNLALSGRTSNWVAGIAIGSCGTWTTPTAAITTGGSTTVCEGMPVALTANSGAGYTYQWFMNGAAVNGATAQTYAATTSGSYVMTIGGNCSTSSATSVTVIPLTITAPADVTTYANYGCSAIGVSLGTPATGGSCYTENVSNDYHDSYFPVGVTTVNWIVRNASGATATATQIVTVIDNVNPTITAPANLIAYTNSDCSATGVSLGTPATADNCSVASVTNDHPSTTFPLGTTTVAWTVTDASGNIAAAVQTVTVIDNINPTIAAPGDITVNSNSGCSATDISIGTPATNDNCSVGSVTNDHPSTTFPVGATAVTWVATDASGNSATAVQTVTVIDNINPTITVPADVTVYTNSGCSATGVSLSTPATDDNCSVASITNDHELTTFPIGTTTVKWTVTDASGNTAAATQIVKVIDNVNPTITAPANVTAYTNSGCSATDVALGNPSTDDNCSVSRIANDHESTTFSIGTTTVKWTVTDKSGNTAMATQTVTVIDNVNPTITAPTGITAYTNSGCTATGIALGSPVTNDNCSVASVTNDHESTTFSVGTTTVNWTVTDANRNTATAIQTVTVIDNVNPTITAPANITVNSATGSNSATVSVGTPATADNCTVASVTNNHPSSSYPVGTTTITWTVTDGSGNTSSANQTITVNDAEAPHAVARNYTLNLSSGTGTVTPENINNGSYDNCGISSMSVSPNTFTCSQAGSNRVTLTVTDIHGNVSTCTCIVTVQYNPRSTVTVTPASGDYTGGVANNIYLGYGPQTAALSVSATGGSGFTYSWSPATALSSSTAANPTFSTRTAGQYTYTVITTNSNGCSVSKTVSMSVIDAVDHSHCGKVLLCHVTSGCHSNRQQLSISANAVAAHLSEHSDDRLGTCSGGCHRDAREELLADAGSVPEATQVFPNPSNGTFTIIIPATRTDAVIIITDFTGRVLETRSLSENTGSPIEFSLNDAVPGMYFVRVTAGEYSHIEKMTVR